MPLRMSKMRCCLNVAVMLFAGAIVGLAAPFGVRVFLVAGRTVLRGRAVVLRRRRPVVR